MELLFHNSYVTLELAVRIKTVYNVTIFWRINSVIFKESSHLFFQKGFADDINALLKSILSR